MTLSCVIEISLSFGIVNVQAMYVEENRDDLHQALVQMSTSPMSVCYGEQILISVLQCHYF